MIYKKINELSVQKGISVKALEKELNLMPYGQSAPMPSNNIAHAQRRIHFAYDGLKIQL